MNLSFIINISKKYINWINYAVPILTALSLFMAVFVNSKYFYEYTVTQQLKTMQLSQSSLQAFISEQQQNVKDIAYSISQDKVLIKQVNDVFTKKSEAIREVIARMGNYSSLNLVEHIEFVDNLGNVILSKDPNNGRIDKNISSNYFLQKLSDSGQVNGFENVASKVFIMSSVRIFYEYKKVGTLIVGRRLSQKILSNWSKALNLDLYFLINSKNDRDKEKDNFVNTLTTMDSNKINTVDSIPYTFLLEEIGNNNKAIAKIVLVKKMSEFYSSIKNTVLKTAFFIVPAFLICLMIIVFNNMFFVHMNSALRSLLEKSQQDVKSLEDFQEIINARVKDSEAINAFSDTLLTINELKNLEQAVESILNEMIPDFRISVKYVFEQKRIGSGNIELIPDFYRSYTDKQNGELYAELKGFGAKKLSTREIIFVETIFSSANLRSNSIRHFDMVIKKEIEAQEKNTLSKIHSVLMPSSYQQSNFFELADFHLFGTKSFGDILFSHYHPGLSVLNVYIGDAGGAGHISIVLATSVLGFIFAHEQNIQADEDANILFSGLNSIVLQYGQQNATISLQKISIDFSKNKVTIYNCGHLLPLISDASFISEKRKKILKPIGNTGMNLGTTTNFKNKFHVSTINLESNMIFALYADGLIEACNSKQEEYGIDRLNRIISVNAGLASDKIVKMVSDDFNELAGNVENQDDATLLVLKISDLMQKNTT